MLIERRIICLCVALASMYAIGADVSVSISLDATSNTGVLSSSNPSEFLETIHFTATVAPVQNGLPIPTGNVTFNIDGVDQAPVALDANGQVVFSVSTLAQGVHNIIVKFPGDGEIDASTSPKIVQKVKPPAVFRKADTENPLFLGAVEFKFSSGTDADFRYSYDFNYDGVTPNFAPGYGDGSYAGGVTFSATAVPAQFIKINPNHIVLGRIIDAEGIFTDYLLQQPDFHTDENDSIVLNATVGDPFAYTVHADGLPVEMNYTVRAADSGATLADVGLSFAGDQIIGTLTKAGVVTLVMTATSRAGLDSAFLVINVANPVGGTNPPVIASRIVGMPNPAIAGSPVTFSVTATDGDGDILSYFWNFGDGTISREQVPTHVYAAPGLYAVFVTVTDGKNNATDQLAFNVLDHAANTYTITSAKLTFNFVTPSKSVMSLQGYFPPPAGYTGANAELTISITGTNLVLPLKVDAKGAFSDAYTKFTLKKSGTNSMKFALILKSQPGTDPQKPSHFQLLSPLGYKNETIGRPGATINLPVVLLLKSAPPITHYNTVKTRYRAVVNKKGTAINIR